MRNRLHKSLVVADSGGKKHSGISQVDIAVLFGGSVVAGADVLTSAIKNNLARKYIIVGGAGHTTPVFRSSIAPFLQREFSAQATEVELFNQYLKEKYNLQADFLECESTNCGNNITLLVSLLQREKIPFDSVLMIHDATMQRRISASWRRYVGEQTLIINL